MKIAFRSLANGKFVCAENAGNQPLIANRDTVAQWEEFEPMVQINGVWVLLELPAAVPSVQPVKPPVPPFVPPTGTPREQFMTLVAGKPFGQQTLLDLEPTLNAMGWQLTPPNAVGERTKVHPPGGPWTRVGFGEGFWVWTPQAEQ